MICMHNTTNSGSNARHIYIYESICIYTFSSINVCICYHKTLQDADGETPLHIATHL